MTQILEVAADLFAEAGYSATSTNAIAARAGISSGSLYQYFPNKEAIARALSQRYAAALAAAHDQAFAIPQPDEPLAALVDRIVDPVISFLLANPAFKRMMGGADAPPALLEATVPLTSAVASRTQQMLAARLPPRPLDQLQIEALTAVHLFQGLVPMITSVPEGRRRAAIVQTKLAMTAYLERLTGEGLAGKPGS